MTESKARSTPATISKQHVEATFDFVEKTKFHRKTPFDIVAVFGNKVERCFDIVAGVDGV